MADFGRQRTLKKAIIFALFWVAFHFLILIAFGMLSGALIALLIDGNTNPNIFYGLAAIGQLAAILVPACVGFLVVYRKWGVKNVVNVFLYFLVVIFAASPLWLLDFALFALLAMRPTGKSVPAGFAARLIFFLMLMLPLVLFVRAGFLAKNVQTEFQRSTEAIHAKYSIERRNIQRRADAERIAITVYFHAIDYDGGPIQKIPETDIEICRPHALDCSGMLDLTKLLGEYPVAMDSAIPVALTAPLPVDPSAPLDSKGTRYAIRKTKDLEGSDVLRGYLLTVTALDAEGGEKITVTQ